MSNSNAESLLLLDVLDLDDPSHLDVGLVNLSKARILANLRGRAFISPLVRMVQVSPSPHDNPHPANKKDLDLERGAALRLRRQSVDLGLNLQVSSGEAPKHTLLDLKALTNGQVEAIAESLILAIKGCSGVEQAMEVWTSDELPQAESEEVRGSEGRRHNQQQTLPA